MPIISPVIQFEHVRRSRLLRSRSVMIIGLLLALGMLYWSFLTVGLTSAAGNGRALQNIADFVSRMNPQLQAAALLEDTKTPGSLAYWYHRWPVWRDLMIETIQIAWVALVLSTVLGMMAALLSASTTNPFGRMRWLVRRFLELVRTVPDLIMAIILVTVLGLGPLAGIVTLTLSGIGTLGRYFGESLENVDLRQRDALQATGAGHLQQVRFGIIPQVMPVLLSFTFLRMETSIASATTLGLVGAGGIGAELIRAMDFNQYQSYFAILLLILVVVVCADLLSEFIRHRVAQSGAML